MNRAPKGLGTAGKALWEWIVETCDHIEGTEPAAEELCRIKDRLHQVRDAINRQGVSTRGKKNTLLDVEIKLSAQFLKTWRTLGLADKPDETKRPVGRPPESERTHAWRA
jgi:hypothetical protein